MSFTKLAINNVKKNLTTYILFLCSQVFTVIIMYTFLSLIFDKSIQEAIADALIFYVSLALASVILIIFVTLFNGYMTALMNKKRKKEVGIYTLLGISKKEIGGLLSLETLFLGIFSLFSGLILGVLSSKILITIFLAITKIHLSIGFSINWLAILFTVCLFFFLILMNIISNYWVVYRYTLLELLKADKKRQVLEEGHGVLGILGMLLVIVAYIQLLATNSKFNILRLMGVDGSTTVGALIIALCLIIGTYLLLHSLLPFVLTTLTKNKRNYYSNSNLLVLSNLRFNLKSQINMMSLVTLLITGTLVTVAFSSTLYLSTNSRSKQLIPVSYQISNLPEKETNVLINMIPQDDIKSQRNINTYDTGIVEFISLSQYQVLSGSTLIHNLKNDESFTIIDETMTTDEAKKILHSESIAKANGVVNIKGVSHTSPFNSQHIIMVVNDNTYSKFEKLPVKNYVLIDLKEGKDNLELAQKLDKQSKRISSSYNPILSSLQTQYESSTTGGLFLFVSLFVSIIFVIATGAILYFKQSNEAYSQIDQFKLMRKLGMENYQIKRITSNQLQIIFFTPLFLGTLHCILLIGANYLATGTPIKYYWPLFVILVLYGAVFILYYLLTLNRYKKITLS